MTILNLTQHRATSEQIEAGVQEMPLIDSSIMTFTELPTKEDIESRVAIIVSTAAKTGAKKAMIGGAPYLMTHLAKSLVVAGIEPLFAFTLRESEDIPQEDGSVKKVAVFKHAGFVPAF